MPCTISRGPTPTTSCETENTGSVRPWSSSCATVSDVACAASGVAVFGVCVAGRRPALPRFRNRVRCRGSRTSRTPSPSRLKANTVTRIARPGNTPIHQAVVRKPWASYSMRPQEGSGGCTPSPRNDRAASDRIAKANEIDVCTTTGPEIFGSTWPNRMRGVDTPIVRAACTNCVSRTRRVSARATRAKIGM